MLKGPFSFQRSLLLNLTLVVILLGLAMLATELVTSGHITKRLAKAQATNAIITAEERIVQFVEAVEVMIEVTTYRIRKGLFQGQWLPEDLDVYFQAVLASIPHVSGIILANADGDSYFLLRVGDAWKSRISRPETWGKRVRWREWTNTNPKRTESWREIDYDARRRPWYKGALAQIAEKGANVPARELVHWTRPYKFFTTKQPGVTGSVAVGTPDGSRFVLALDVLLEDVSEYTRNLRVGQSGMVFVLDGDPGTNDSVLVGLPSDPRFREKADIQRYILRPPQELGGPVADFIADVTRPGHRDQGAPVEFHSGGEKWWGMVRRWDVLTDHPLWVGMVISEEDLLRGVPDLTDWVIGLTALILLLGVMRSVQLSRIYSSPIEGLVHQSERMQRLNFEPSEPVRSNISEIRLMATTLERMRQALHSFSSIREDIRIARSIRRATIPEALPTLPGFQMEAWSEPSAEVGGESYDMVNFWTALRGAHRGSAGQADGVAFLFFDAAGFGVNTAVKCSQLRAIFRTGVRLGVDLPNLAEQMDHYLRNDVPESGPVRAWFGLLDGHDSRLSSLCAGHETVLRYVAQEEGFLYLEGQSSALGGEEGIAIPHLQSVQLVRGDIISVVSDGVVDALSPVRERFGLDRIKQVITEHHQADATEIVEQLRQALTDFSSGSEADDDRTILLIKCV